MIQSYLRAHSSRKQQLNSRRRRRTSYDSDTLEQSDSTLEQQTAYRKVLTGSQRP